MKKKRVIVLMGGQSAEYRVSLASGREVVRYLDKKKYEILPVIISHKGYQWQSISPKQILHYSPDWKAKIDNKDLIFGGQKIEAVSFTRKTDVVFIALHGRYGEDGTVQGMLELAGIRYTGSGVLASALGMDKIMFKKIMESEKILIPKFLVVDKEISSTLVLEKFGLPLVVKPSFQGSSVGVSIVREKKNLIKALDLAFKFGQKAIVEEYLSGIEVTCGVIGNKHPVALPIAEIVSRNEFFDYEAKYVIGKSDEIIPARISRVLTEEVQKTAIKVYQAIGCRGFGRVDMIIFRGKPYVLEINTIPGLTPNSILPKEAVTIGITYPKLLDRLIELAMEE